ncbi:helix-turn-helix transcriptional regulator [Salisediminibacterium beveridgei]|uniref:HTH deoR-type domain-containing protein n=1 Tax=Salisediminibacterium beveridgei TaxID=632773 RepID=A0A1D7QYV4_9BACI|nr:transcriptional regulator [Salisediminibacterium beveridgei]AOM84194.1 conserved hypothetical protein with Helix-turn-helix, type 11 domain [Salisediminibacterium beveridgei]
MTEATFNKSERLFYIMHHLSNHDTVTANDLADHCQTTKRTIYRDIQFLQTQGHEIQAQGREGYRLLIPNMQVKSKLTKDEWLSLTLYPLLSTGITSKEHPFHRSYRTGLEKVMRMATGETPNPAIAERIRLHARTEDAVQARIMPALIQAMSENLCVDVRYYAMHRSEWSERRLEPYYLVPREGHLYLVAYCRMRQGIRVFRLNRFEEAKVTDVGFAIPKAFSIDTFLKQRWSIMEEEDPFEIVVRFSPEAAKYVDEEEFYVETKKFNEEDGTLTLKVTVGSRQEFLRWVRSFGPDAEVLSPVSLRRELADEYSRMFRMYQGDEEKLW